MDKILKKIDTLFCLLEYSTAKWPRRRMSSSVDGSQAYTYASFHSKVAEVSALLAQHRVYGGKVAILSENCPNWTVAFFASAGMGRVAVPYRRFGGYGCGRSLLYPWPAQECHSRSNRREYLSRGNRIRHQYISRSRRVFSSGERSGTRGPCSHGGQYITRITGRCCQIHSGVFPLHDAFSCIGKPYNSHIVQNRRNCGITA